MNRKQIMSSTVKAFLVDPKAMLNTLMLLVSVAYLVYFAVSFNILGIILGVALTALMVPAIRLEFLLAFIRGYVRFQGWPVPAVPSKKAIGEKMRTLRMRVIIWFIVGFVIFMFSPISQNPLIVSLAATVAAALYYVLLRMSLYSELRYSQEWYNLMMDRITGWSGGGDDDDDDNGPVIPDPVPTGSNLSA